jgi:ubiquinone/menaquinone biosynthesis C-methylase UbiE
VDRWNHNTHYFPLLAAKIPATANRILDVGCGDGTLCQFLTTERRLVVGVDTDRSVLPPTCAGMRFAATSADALSFADRTFDAVVMSMVLHHVNAERGMTDAARVLAPGGVLLILGYGRFGGLHISTACHVASHHRVAQALHVSGHGRWARRRGRQTKRQGDHSLPLSTYSAVGGLRQARGRPAESPGRTPIPAEMGIQKCVCC